MKEKLIREIMEMLRKTDIMELEAIRNVLMRLNGAGGETYEGSHNITHRGGRA